MEVFSVCVAIVAGNALYASAKGQWSEFAQRTYFGLTGALIMALVLQ